MQKKVIKDSNSSMQVQSSSTVTSAKLQTVENGRMTNGTSANVPEASRERTLMKETENEVGTSGKGNDSEKRRIF